MATLVSTYHALAPLLEVGSGTDYTCICYTPGTRDIQGAYTTMSRYHNQGLRKVPRYLHGMYKGSISWYVSRYISIACDAQQYYTSRDTPISPFSPRKAYPGISPICACVEGMYAM